MSDEIKIEEEDEFKIELEETLEDLFQKWKQQKKSSELLKLTKTDLHCSLAGYEEAALRLQFLQDEKRTRKGTTVGEALNTYFQERFKISAEEFERLDISLMQTIKKALKIYEDHTGIAFTFTEALGYNWDKEAKIWKNCNKNIDKVKSDIEQEVPIHIALKELDKCKESFQVTFIKKIVTLISRIKAIDEDWVKRREKEEILSVLENLSSDTRIAMKRAQEISKLIKDYHD